MKIVKEVLRSSSTAILVWLLVNAVELTVFVLYGVMAEPMIYAAWLSFCMLAAILTAEFFRERKRSRQRQRAAHFIAADRHCLPEPHSLAEEEYQEMIAALGDKLERLSSDFIAQRQDQLDYYTAWVHQIKTPIAVMKLRLSDDSPESLLLRAELLRIEQYVDMVLQYLRLDSDSNDLVIREYALDELIRESVRRFAPLFLEKKLRLDYAPTGLTVITDRKWFVCILEQMLSNAVKYTPSGTVSVGTGDGVLYIADTGIGIAPEDLPRIFERGYTGLNGRIGQKSTGLGLYLAKKAADMLAIPLRAESRVGEGSRFLLAIRQP